MRKKGNRIHSVILIICILVSCLCFEGIKTDDTMRIFVASFSSGQFITSGNEVSNDDVCTLEMLGNAQTGFLALPTAKRGSQLQRKSETMICDADEAPALRSAYKFFSSANVISAVNACIAEILCFIHDKDGKKRI
jgi:hypothetical protein